MRTLKSWRDTVALELQSNRATPQLATAHVYTPGTIPRSQAAEARGQLGRVAGFALCGPTESKTMSPSADLVGLPTVTDTKSVATQISSGTQLRQIGLATEDNNNLRLVDFIQAMRRTRSTDEGGYAKAWTPLRCDPIDEAGPTPDLSNVQVVMQVLLVPRELAATTLLQFDCIGRHINFPADVTALGSTEWFRTVDKEHPVILLPLSAVMSPGSNAQTLAFLADRQRSPVFRQRYEEPASELHIVHVVLVDPISNKSPQEASTDRFTTLKDAVEFLHGMAEKIAVK